ncbi:copper chaperone PCu(A)C [Leucobacter sp. M11]|uniref:copper chaperone PCu(A)C n=1 Tax=Leucobacter sp. M11 TaxID=2993565 RepID=UPI002D7FD445|nr:copper chaperone PCu(A)C [Leucobacter sp. M11]MEB4615928.1 copper chaperone PCu(A)C [Leucobacter sp. M11]
MNTAFISARRSLSVAAIAVGALLTPLALTACSSPGAAEETTQESRTMAENVTFEGAWAKVAEAKGMSGAFGVLENTGDAEVTLTGATSDRADMIEIHEFVDVDGTAVMQQMEGDFTIAAGKSRELVPGGEHLMLMQLPSALLPGEELPLVLTFSDGSTLPVTLPIRDYAGANEVYGEGDEEMDHGSMDSGSMDSDSMDHGSMDHGSADTE